MGRCARNAAVEQDVLPLLLLALRLPRFWLRFFTGYHSPITTYAVCSVLRHPYRRFVRLACVRFLSALIVVFQFCYAYLHTAFSTDYRFLLARYLPTATAHYGLL